MKKLTFIGAAITSFLTPFQVLAAASDINILPPEKGFLTIGNFVNNALLIAFAFAILFVLIMLIWGAFEWISSGGDKENVGKARGRIINALIGLAVLAVAYALAKVAGQFLGFDITTGINIPTPNRNPGPGF